MASPMLPSKTSLTAEEVRNCTFTFSHFDGPYRVSIGRGTHPVTGVPIIVQQREFIEDEHLQALNMAERNARDGKRWSAGAGSDKGGNMPMIRVARTPLNKFYAEVAPRIKTDGQDFVRYWLNQDKNAPFRTRSGKL
jgi:hypothetical protein